MTSDGRARDGPRGCVSVRPVFIEPTFRHEFLSCSRYMFIVLFELAVAVILIAWFFGDEARHALSRAEDDPPEPDIDSVASGTRLACDGDALVILGLPGGRAPALNRDGSEVRLRGCEELLRSVNGL